MGVYLVSNNPQNFVNLEKFLGISLERAAQKNLQDGFRRFMDVIPVIIYNFWMMLLKHHRNLMYSHFHAF